MRKKVCILSDHHLCSNPRVWKEAKTLVNNGYEVVILTVFTSEELLKKDLILIEGLSLTYKGVVDFTTNNLDRFTYRAIRKLAKALKHLLNIDTHYLLGYAPFKIYRAAKHENADIYIAHMDCCLFVGVKLATKGKKVAFDFEDWYSRDYLVAERPVKLIRRLERTALKAGVYCSCPSNAMASAILKEYSVRSSIEVIYNGFSSKENITPDRNPKSENSLVWFSQTIGPGRGIEKLVSILHFVQNPVQLHLIGDIAGDFDAFLKKDFPSDKHSLHFHAPVNHSELIPLLAKHTIGLAIEEYYPESRNVTITNKILQYIQAGIKVLATDTKGQKEVARYFPSLISVIPAENVEVWPSALEKLLSRDEKNAADCYDIFNKVFSWEAQEPKLLSLVSTALHD